MTDPTVSRLDLAVQGLADRLSAQTATEPLPEGDFFRALRELQQLQQAISDRRHQLGELELHRDALPPAERSRRSEEFYHQHLHLSELSEGLRRLLEKLLRSSLQPGMNLSGLEAPQFDLHGMDLSRVNLTEAALWRAELQQTNLQAAHLDGAILFGTDLTGADLQGASLRGADLFCAKFIGANLDGADLTEADLDAAHFTGASLRGTLLKGTTYRKYDAQYELKTKWPEGFDPEAAGAKAVD